MKARSLYQAARAAVVLLGANGGALRLGCAVHRCDTTVTVTICQKSWRNLEARKNHLHAIYSNMFVGLFTERFHGILIHRFQSKSSGYAVLGLRA